MKNKKAFSLAEIVIAIIVMGVIGVLTLPTMTKGIEVRQKLHAYNQAYEKVQNAISDNGIEVLDSLEPTGHKIWKALDDALGVVGYYSAEAAYDDGNHLIIENKDLKPCAKWTGKGGVAILGTYEGKDCTNATKKSLMAVDDAKGFSPWIVTQNGMAFTIDAWSTGIEDTSDVDTRYNCADAATLFRAKNDQNLRHYARHIACDTVMVDVNGLDKGPNSYAGKNSIEESEMEAQVKNNDRFYIFITRGGAASPGPQGLTEYWMRKRHTAS